MQYVGISSGFHDAALSVVDSNGDILFAGHSERYTKIKHDKDIGSDLIADASQYLNDRYQVHYYEKPWLKKLRQIRSGESWAKIFTRLDNNLKLGQDKLHCHSHHLSHAAAGFQTSPFEEATVLVIDAIGEFDTATIWHAYYQNGRAEYKKLWSLKYPNSLGLFYSAMTKRVGLKPLDEEYILMGMAAYGTDKYSSDISNNLVEGLRFNQNLHIGVDDTFLEGADGYDIATSTQVVLEDLLSRILQKASKLGKSKNLVYGGGVALNCLANRLIGGYFDSIWIMPNPGDAGSSLGAAALGYGKKLNWKNAYLGHCIQGDYPVMGLLKELEDNKIVGVANGRAEFGPRALGNRSLLADPRGPEIKDKVNEIKRRQKFRPFAPVILEELASSYFTIPSGWSDSRYMQVVAPCRHPDLFPAIVHHDGTSRVQTVPNDGSGIRQLLEAWYAKTSCPMLLNTSLNIRGEPMVNDRNDALRFENLYKIRVF